MTQHATTQTVRAVDVHAVLDALPSSLAVLDRQGCIVQVNRAWRRFGEANGLKMAGDGVGANYLTLCGASGLPEAREAAAGIRRVMSGTEEEYLQVYACHAPHQERWFQLRVTRLGDDAGHVLVVHEDVTERIDAQHELQRQMAFVRGLVGSSPDCLKVLSLTGELLWMNESGQASMAVPDFRDIQGQPWAALWPPEHQADLQRAVEAACRGERGHFQGYCPTAAGNRKFWDVLVTPILGADGQVIRLLATSRDLTALRAAQQEVLRRAEETAHILSSIQEAFYTLDEDWRFLYLNPQAEVLLEKPAAELLGQQVWQMFPETLSGRFPEQYQKAVDEQRGVCFQEYYPPLGSWFEINAYPHGSGLAVYFQNITARKAEEQAQQDRNDILEMMVQGRALPEILHHVAQMVERQFPGHHCTILLVQGDRLELAAAPGLPPTFHPVLSGIEIREGAGVCGTAVARGEMVVVEDLLTHPDCAGYLRRLPPNALRTCASLPILDGGGVVLGALALYGTAPGPFSGQTLSVLSKARHLAAVAIEHHRLTGQLRHQANHDVLTGLANRQLFEKSLQEALQTSARLGTPASLLFIDIDEFKDINDNFGHPVGDEVLRLLAGRLKGCVRPADTLARISGDEFTVVMPLAEEQAARETAARVHEALALPLVLPGRELSVTASIGISVTPEGGPDGAAMQRSADLALYAAKRRKPGSVVFHQKLADQASERFRLGADLRRATERGELELHYQPVVQLGSRRVVGAEALLRWRHPDLGLVPPATFIPVAEETGLIVPIGEWVLREACRQGAVWRRQGRAFHLAVNVSAVQFGHPDFVDTVAACLRDTGFPARRLELELTERVVMSDAEESVRRMQHLRNLGVSISVDDFGTGYSSLSYLPRLPLNTLKIDRSFVSQLHPASSAYAVVRAIIMLAQSLGLETVAEGVETAEELAVLRDLGCTLGQGYLFARPLRATDPFWTAAASEGEPVSRQDEGAP
ncbi:hypothetical protein DEIPH_ctg046orf0076 [Deinococcus phoenicis]|uniref:PAS/PAC and GAF sensor-containing diguanylate cyclase/phosphodiesterase n=1 Tax=Deinococcus phoenicis TaxID=1476583 RepID=A0A016QMG5_9DEIO|nr:EAL domain-containing protein [Deinococcus phoenicis]EYB67268.1 hypothetical protein DEIPH_ctg046orf0076 [Deinococcus phoenicis]